MHCIALGLISNLIGFLFFLLLTHYGANPKIAISIMYFLNLSINFWGNLNWVFSSKENILSVGIKYLCAYSLAYCINIVILLIFVDYLNYSYKWTQLGAIIVVASYLLVIFKSFVFKTPHRVYNES